MRPTLFTVLALAVFAAGCKRAETAAPAAASAPRVVNVRVAPVESSTATPVVRVAGILARQTEADLSFPLPGLLAEVNATPVRLITKTTTPATTPAARWVQKSTGRTILPRRRGRSCAAGAGSWSGWSAGAVAVAADVIVIC